MCERQRAVIWLLESGVTFVHISYVSPEFGFVKGIHGPVRYKRRYTEIGLFCWGLTRGSPRNSGKARVGPKISEVGPKKAQVGPKMAQDRVKMAKMGGDKRKVSGRWLKMRSMSSKMRLKIVKMRFRNDFEGLR